MTIGLWVLLGIALGLAYVLVFAMCKVAADADRKSRHTEKRMIPWSDVEITVIRP